MPQSVGDDVIEFMISPNPGEPLKPLSKSRLAANCRA